MSMTMSCVFFSIGTLEINFTEFTVPPRAPRPTSHLHTINDESFLITKGRLRSTFAQLSDSCSAPIQIEPAAGDYIVMSIGAPHSFTNPYEQEVVFVNTFAPSFYVDYFRLLSKYKTVMLREPQEMTRIMGRYGSAPLLEEGNFVEE